MKHYIQLWIDRSKIDEVISLYGMIRVWLWREPRNPADENAVLVTTDTKYSQYPSRTVDRADVFFAGYLPQSIIQQSFAAYLKKAEGPLQCFLKRDQQGYYIDVPRCVLRQLALDKLDAQIARAKRRLAKIDKTNPNMDMRRLGFEKEVKDATLYRMFIEAANDDACEKSRRA
ncbi:MAG: hypothetical protein KIG95_12840 [Comamonas sp.]|nr:hypothetical protein [Comamonas sp.]